MPVAICESQAHFYYKDYIDFASVSFVLYTHFFPILLAGILPANVHLLKVSVHQER